MKVLRLAPLFLAATALVAAPCTADAALVKISLNVFPTNVAQPNNGGSWRLVAKTDSSIGIAAISAYLRNINIAGLAVEPDIGAILNGGQPFFGDFGGVINIVYGQDILTGPIIGGVGTLLKSDGTDPFGDPAWDDATRIFSGTYSSALPFFTSLGVNETDANVLASVIVGTAALDADTTTVVRVAVPEPMSVIGGLSAVVGILAARRRR
jgi:hypothetical protein